MLRGENSLNSGALDVASNFLIRKKAGLFLDSLYAVNQSESGNSIIVIENLIILVTSLSFSFEREKR